MEGEGQWGNERRELLSCGNVGTADAAKTLRAPGIPQKTDSTEKPARRRPERRPTIKTEAGLPISAAYPAFLISKFLLRPAKPALGHLFRCPENSSAPGWIPGIRPYTAHCLCTSGKPSEPDRVFPGTGPATADCIYYVYKSGTCAGEVLGGGRLGGRGPLSRGALPSRSYLSSEIASKAVHQRADLINFALGVAPPVHAPDALDVPSAGLEVFLAVVIALTGRA